ncbi:hypothetical protein ACFQYP_43445 [Nonomuraea antimicrobica]
MAAGIGLGVACVGVSGPGREAFKQVVGLWGGFAVFRDAQQYVAPLALAAAVGLGLLAEHVARRRVWVAALALVPVAVLPTMAWGSLGRLGSVSYPQSWTAAREVIARDPAPGDVLVLPFESYRRFPWNGGGRCWIPHSASSRWRAAGWSRTTPYGWATWSWEARTHGRRR